MLIRLTNLLLIILITGCAATKPAIQDHERLDAASQSIEDQLPDGFEALYRDGLLLMEQEKFDLAKQHWTIMSEMFDQYPGVWTNLGLARFHSGDFKGAVAAYKHVELNAPEYCPVYSVSGIAYRELGQFDDAEASYIAAINCYPDEGRHYFNLGILLDLYRNDLVGALGNYRKARRLMPENKQLNIWIVDLARRVGTDVEDPVDLDSWETSVKVRPSNKVASSE